MSPVPEGQIPIPRLPHWGVASIGSRGREYGLDLVRDSVYSDGDGNKQDFSGYELMYKQHRQNTINIVEKIVF